MPQTRLSLVMGLGNPGDEYRKTRHNVGFMVADSLADRLGIDFQARRTLPDLLFGRGRIGSLDLFLAKPQSYMNRSGLPTVRLMNYFGIRCEDIVVVHDDIDLALGRLKIKEKGGHGGHKGVQSIMDAMGRDDFVRLRIGVGRSEAGAGVTDHVLGRFFQEELAVLEPILERARDAIETILCNGAKEGMNRFNNTRITSS